MLGKFHYAPNVEAARQDSAKQTAASSWSIANTLSNIRHAVAAGLAAHRRYEHLKSTGIPHDTALKAAFGVRIAGGDGTATPHTAAKQLSGHELCSNGTSWFARRRQRRALARLDDRLLRDIRLPRAQALRESGKSLFFAGKA